jgi:isoaspartyl peptidase/L-asparaginase-like protein (Ntn-hydrolase superfamily)
MNIRSCAFGVSLVVACATTDEAETDPFEPPERPLVYRRDCDPCPQPKPRARPRSLAKSPKLDTLAGEALPGFAAVAHAGVGSAPALSDGPKKAADTAVAQLSGGASPLDAAIAGTVVLEDDPRFNAGTGSFIRIDGKTIQMDASLMTSEGQFAAVAVIERVKNPILVARAILETPHLLLAGEGATRFAHKMGFADVVPTCKEAEDRYADRMKRLRAAIERGEAVFDPREVWNFPNAIPELMREWKEHGDTVGTIARDREGRFAATLSTGGTSITLYGRVGDVPIYGAGAFAGPAGAVACTGDGEVIVREMLARRVYEELEGGIPAREAVARAVADFPAGGTVGIIALDRLSYGVAANRPMAFGVANEE